MTTILNQNQVEKLVNLNLTEDLASVTIAFNQSGIVYVSELNEQGFRTLAEVFGVSIVFSDNAVNEFTQPISLAELQFACKHGLQDQVIKVNHKVYFDGGFTMYQLSLADYKGWRTILEECSSHNDSVTHLWYRVSPAEFRAQAEIRGGCWKLRASNKQVAAAAAGVVAALALLPTSILMGVGGAIVGAAIAKGNKSKN